MAFSRVAGGSNNRRRTTRTNYSRMSPGQRRRSLLGNTAANNAASERFRRRRATQAASQPPAPTTDPLTNVLSQQQQMMLAQGGGSMGAQPSMADAQGGGGATAPVNQQPSMADAQGTGASQPANMPPPPPPPPPAPPAPQPTMAQMQGTGAPPAPQPTMAEMQGGGNVARQPTMAEMQGTGAPPAPTMAQMQAPNPVSPLDGSVRPSGGPPAPSFTTTNVATGPDTGVGQTEFVPQDPGAAMAAMQGTATAPPALSPGEEMAARQGAGVIAQPSMADAQGSGVVVQQPSMADAQGTGQAPTLSYGEEMAMRQNAANRAMNDRLGDALRSSMSYGEEMATRQGGRTPSPAYTSSYEQAALLQRGTPTMSYGEEMASRQSGGMTPGEEMAARQGAGLPDVSGYRSSYEEAALAQGGNVAAAPSGATDAQAEMFARQGDGGLRTFASTGGTEEQLAMEEMQQRPLSGDPALESQLRAQLEMAARQGLTTTSADTGRYVNPYADAAAQQEDTGLRTFTSSPQFNENAAELEAIARRQDAGLQTFAAPGSRYNRGAEQLRRQAGQRLSGTLQDRLEQAYMGRIDAANDPILASQIADQQLRQQEAQQGLVEQLSRYGVLRGGGDTAAALTRMAEGNERNRLALEAAAAQRRQGDLRDALAFDQARSAMNIAQRGQSLEERIGADRLLDTALARDVTRAGQTGQFQGVDTLAAQEQRQRMDLAEREQDLRERTGEQDIATSTLARDVTRAGLTGQFERADTLAAQEQRQRMDLAERETALRENIGGETILDRQQARDIAAAGLTGQFQDQDTLQAQEQALRMDLARAGVTGELDGLETLAGERQRRELALGESAQETRDRLADQDIASSALARDVTRAGLTGQFERQDTLAAQLQRQQMQLAEDANRRADIAQRAGLLGEVAGEGSAPARTTLAGRELALREDLARAEDLRAQQAAESALYGQVVTGTDTPIATLQGQRAVSDLDTAALAREATEAGLTGEFEGAMTADERDRDLSRRIAEAGVTGRFGDQDTIQSQVIESSLQNEALNRALSRAGATGLFREEGDTADPTETLESRLRTAGLTGELGGQLTLGGRQAEQDLIGSILAASDPELEGRTDALAEALAGRLGIEERSRVERRFQDEIAELGDDLSFDDFYRLAEEYADYPSITDALDEMMREQARKREEEEEGSNPRGRGGANPVERNRINPRTGQPMV